VAERASPLAAIYFTGRFGRLDQGGPALALTERRGLQIVEVAAWDVPGVELPGPGQAMALEAGVALWIGPDRWWLIDAPDLPVRDAAVVDQSHGVCCIRIAGAPWRETLAKGCPLDLDTLMPGTVASTRLGPFQVRLHAMDARTVDLYVARSYAQACWEWLTDAAGEYGYEVA
jgi:sarcosine oxidase subunit gamma